MEFLRVGWTTTNRKAFVRNWIFHQELSWLMKKLTQSLVSCAALWFHHWVNYITLSSGGCLFNILLFRLLKIFYLIYLYLIQRFKTCRRNRHHVIGFDCRSEILPHSSSSQSDGFDPHWFQHGTLRGWSGRNENASLLSFRWHDQHGLANGINRRR